MAVELSECEHGHAERPQAEEADAALVFGDEEGVAEGVLQVADGDADLFAERGFEFGGLLAGR